MHRPASPEPPLGGMLNVTSGDVGCGMDAANIEKNWGSHESWQSPAGVSSSLESRVGNSTPRMDISRLKINGWKIDVF